MGWELGCEGLALPEHRTSSQTIIRTAGNWVLINLSGGYFLNELSGIRIDVRIKMRYDNYV